MRIITTFKALDISEETLEALRETPLAPCTKAEAKTWIFQGLCDAFNGETPDSESYLSDCTDDDENFIFGALEPEKLVSIAKGWNQEIKENFIAALAEIGGPNVTVDNLPMDNDKTYKLQGVARELDNNWWQYASHATYLPNSQGYPYFRCVIEDAELADIVKQPEQYVIIDVYVK